MDGTGVTRTARLCRVLAEAGLDAAVLTDPDSIAYFADYWNYLGVDFGRPTLFVVRADADPVIITPLMGSEMCGAMSWVRTCARGATASAANGARACARCWGMRARRGSASNAVPSPPSSRTISSRCSRKRRSPT